MNAVLGRSSIINFLHCASSASHSNYLIHLASPRLPSITITTPNRFRQPSTLTIFKMRSAITTRARHPNALPANVAASASSSEDDQGNSAARMHHPLLETINESTKWTVSAAVFSTLAIKRDIMCSWWVLGSIIAAVLCRGLKYVLKAQVSKLKNVKSTRL